MYAGLLKDREGAGKRKVLKVRWSHSILFALDINEHSGPVSPTALTMIRYVKPRLCVLNRCT